MRFLISCALFFCMLTCKVVGGNFMIIGHRGAWGHAPENTLASFSKALQIGVDAVELDVHLAKSGELVVIHDDTVDRVSNGKGRVADKTLQELKEYTLEGGEKIPTLIEVFDLIDRRCIINIELKGPSTARPVAELIRKYVAEKGWSAENFLVSSFNHHELFAFHQLLPEVQTGAILEGIPFHYAAFAEDVGATHAVLCLSTVNKEFVGDAHRRGLKVFVYTVNEPEDMKHLIDMGVDGMISNFPDRCKSFQGRI
jgi:glycerophosphoryl diester phosphodiesterase